MTDTSCTALMLLAGKVHDEGFKVALTGEGSDEWLAGYPWYKFDRVFEGMGIISGGRLHAGVKKMFFNWLGCSKDAVAYLERCVPQPAARMRFRDFTIFSARRVSASTAPACSRASTTMIPMHRSRRISAGPDAGTR